MKNKLLVLVLLFCLTFLGCPQHKEPMIEAQEALSTHKELLESAKSESLASQIVQFESRLAKATPFLERTDLPKELTPAQESLQKAHNAWRSAITKIEKIPKASDEEKANLQSEISSYMRTAETNVEEAERIIEKLKK